MKEDINNKFKEANNLIKNKKYKEAKDILKEYINKNKELYIDSKKNNYSFIDLTQFYLFVNIFKTKKDTQWINLKCDEAYRLLGYIAVEEKEYEDALKYLHESLKYNPINIETFFELVETYKMMGNLDKMYETLDCLYDYIYEPFSLSRYYRNLGFYFIEKENYDLAFSLYLISLEYQFNQFALSEMLYIRKQLNNPNFNIEKKEALKILTDNKINIGILNRNLKLLKELSKDKKLIDNNPNYINKIKEIIKILSKTIE